MPTPLPRNADELARHVARFIDALDNPAGHTASGIDAADFTALGADFDTLHDDLKAQREAEAAHRAAVEKAQGSRRTAEARYRALRQQAGNHTAMTDALRASAGLTVRDREPSPGALPEILDLAAFPRPNGSTRLTWTGPTGGSLRYEVFSHLGADAAWVLVGSATATQFTHEKAGAGVHRTYHVQACRGRRRSEPSNLASVYA